MKYIITVLTLLFAFNLSSGDYIDSLGYRLYHDMDNEHDGSKLRMYVGKDFYHSKLKIAFERGRQGQGLEAGTFSIDHAIKF